MANAFCCRCVGHLRTRPTRVKIYLAIAFCGLTLWFMRNLDTYQDELSLVVTLRKAALSERAETRIGGGGGGNLSGPQTCKLPVLELYPSGIRFAKPSALRCDGEARWTFVRDGRLWFNQSAVRQLGPLACQATAYLRVSDFSVTPTGQSYAMFNGSIVLHDVFRLDCKAGSHSQTLVHHAIPPDTRPEQTPVNSKESSSKEPLGSRNLLKNVNVLLLGIDTMSRLSVIRHLPATYQYFVNEMKGHVMEAYGVYGDGTPAALCPLLTGISEEELPEARRGFPNASEVDDWPWVWQAFKQAGYETLWHEETPEYGTFTYRMLGFRNQPVDLYGRNFEMAMADLVGSVPLCYASEPKYRLLLNWLTEFLSLRSQKAKFAFAFHSELTHDANRIELADSELKQLLQSLRQQPSNRNTIVLLFSDHGPRFNAMRRTFQGKYEERLPFMGVALPPDWYNDDWVQRNSLDLSHASLFLHWRDQVLANLRANSQILSLPFDAHATLLDILYLSQLQSVHQFGAYNVTKEGTNARATSLFRPLASDRNCDNLGVKAHWCTCLLWSPVDLHSAVTQQAAVYLVAFMNRLLEQVQADTQCAALRLSKVLAAGKLSPNADVLRFKSSSDQHGRVADLSDTLNLEFFWLQLTVLTTPNAGEYEATIRVHPSAADANAKSPLADPRFDLSEREISRINPYGSAPSCIADQYPHLRPYCSCVSA